MWVGSDRESCLCGSFNHSYEAFLLFPLASHRALPGSESVSGIFLSVLAYVYKSLLAKMDSSTEVYVTSSTMGWCPLPLEPLSHPPIYTLEQIVRFQIFFKNPSIFNLKASIEV